MIKAAEFLIGLLIVCATLRDVFGTVVVPGESRGLLRIARRLVFLLLPLSRSLRPKDQGLSLGFAPAALLMSFVTWMALLGLGFGVMGHALRASFDPPTSSLPQAIYVASSALVTIGLSETDATGAARWLSLAAGFCGLAVMTMAVTYLLGVQGSIAQRDAGVLKLTTTAGQPPSGLALLERTSRLGRREELPAILRTSRDWCAAVLQSHAAHPSLIYFRSIKRDTGWPAALGAILDTALIVEVLADVPDAEGAAVLLREQGERLAAELTELLCLKPEPATVAGNELEEVRRRVRAAGYPLSEDPSAEGRFLALRAPYAACVRALADHLGMPAAPLVPPAPEELSSPMRGTLGRTSGLPSKATERPMSAELSLVSEFEHQVTGVAVSENGRIFVNFPRWTEDSPISVAEVKDGRLTPYPDAHWNEWRNARKNELSAADRFVCVQSVVCDGRGSLWVLDPAAPAQQQVVEGGPKLVRVDLASDRVTQIIAFDMTVAPQGSYLNDVRFHPNGRTAYITDSGPRGALLVVDLQSGEARRVLDGHPSTQVEKDVVVKIDGRELRRTDGRGAEFSADSIEVTPDGAYVVYQALTGRTVYRISTEALDDGSLSPDAVGDRVEKLAEIGVSDGYWMDRRGRLYMSAVEENAVKVREPTGEVRTFVQDDRLRWPDSFAQGPDGAIYVTTSRIQDNMWFDPEAGPAIRTQLWRAEERA